MGFKDLVETEDLALWVVCMERKNKIRGSYRTQTPLINDSQLDSTGFLFWFKVDFWT